MIAKQIINKIGKSSLAVVLMHAYVRLLDMHAGDSVQVEYDIQNERVIITRMEVEK